jgi:hypothetical protein
VLFLDESLRHGGFAEGSHPSKRAATLDSRSNQTIVDFT